MALSESLFDKQRAPVFESAADWILGTLLGSLAISICIIAVALFGFAMLSGRISVRRGATLVLGCFLLLGAGQLARGLLTLPQTVGSTVPDRAALTIDVAPAEPLPPANYDPYAGASLRRN